MTRKIKKQQKQSSRQKIMLQQGIALSRILLGELASAVGWIMMQGHYNMGWVEYEDRKARQRAYEEREWLRDLKRRKLVETKRIGEKLMVRLTERGWQQALRDRIKSTHIKCKGGICIVIFDVPESERRVRDTLRAVLADCGFSMVQKSVWMSDKDVLKPLCALLQGANLRKWVRVMVGNEIRQSFVRRTSTRLGIVYATKRAGKNSRS